MRPLAALDRYTLEQRLVDGSIRQATTGELLLVLAGDDAASAYGKTGRLWPLLSDPAAFEIGLESRARLSAFAELERRLREEPRHLGTRVSGPLEAMRLFSHLALLEHEEVHAAYLNSQNVVIASERIGVGGRRPWRSTRWPSSGRRSSTTPSA